MTVQKTLSRINYPVNKTDEEDHNELSKTELSLKKLEVMVECLKIW